MFSVVCILVGSAVAQGTPVRLDSSDWWSYTRQEELPVPKTREPIKFQNREPVETNFEIAGVTLGAKWDFSDARSMFGETTEVERGDAASGRNQICYKSKSGSVHLIFELGEVDAVFYLFKDGPKWNGSDFCTVSDALFGNTSTASGLALGLTPSQVKVILGDPSVDTPSKLVYYFEYKKKTPAKAIAEFRKQNPNMSEGDLLKNFGYADVESYVEARFASGKLNYLAVSRSEAY